jgi:hypothetical protein
MKNTQGLVKFLRTEFSALESGDYAGTSERQPWRARLVFEDCSSCPNYGQRERKTPCSECPLINLVPQNRRREKVPCRFIPLNAKGETVDSLYRTGTEKELEVAMGDWLRKTIRALESGPPEPDTTAKPAFGSSRSVRRRNAHN